MPIKALSLAVLCGACRVQIGPEKSQVPQTDSASQPTEETGSPAKNTVALITENDWSELPAEDDPFPSHRPDPVQCDPDGWHPEDGVLEIETNLCNYASLTQPSLASVEAGDTLDLLVYHSALAAPEPAEAHISILLGADVIWEANIPIPSISEIYSSTLTAPSAAPAGTPVVIHLHNHGGNAWKVAHLKRMGD